MSLAISRENFFWHKLHSLTGIIPIGFYLLQHLILNTFSLAGPDKYNGVSGFFYSMPFYVLLGIEILFIWAPLLFHSVYGLFITARADPNYFTSKYKWSQNRMYTLQRYSGFFLFLFLIYHVATTTLQVKLHGAGAADWNAMHNMLTTRYYFFMVVYALGVLAASYHLCYGIWNFCIRWGITVSDRAQIAVQKFSFGMFIVVTLIGWAALAGFLGTGTSDTQQISTMRVRQTVSASV